MADLIDFAHSEWKSTLVTTFFDDQVSKAILNTPITPSLLLDQLVWTETPSGTSVSRLDAWLVERASLPHASPEFAVIAHLLWEIWRRRNNAIFRQIPLDPRQAVNDALAQNTIFKFLQSSPQKMEQTMVSSEYRWQPPAEGYIKCNIDGAFRQESEKGSIACVFRDSRGILTDMLTQSVPAQSAFQAEIYALIFAIQRLLHKNLHPQHVVIESDCSTLVEIIRMNKPPPWKERSLFATLSDLLQRCPNLSLQHVRRQANGAADWAATAHRDHGPQPNWLLFPPSNFLSIISSDASAFICNVTQKFSPQKSSPNERSRLFATR